MPVIFGAVGAPSSTSAADSSNLPLLQGKAGDGIVSELHGKWYTSAYRGRMFHATSPIAGQVIPVMTSTTAQTALSLFNPLGSGVNLELVSFRFGTSITTSTGVIGSIGFGVGQNVGGTQVVPTSQVAATLFGSPLGPAASSPQGKALATCTITALTTFLDIGLSAGLTSSYPFLLAEKTFDGSIVLAPGSILCVQGTVAQTSSYVLGMSWAEYPV